MDDHDDRDAEVLDFGHDAPWLRIQPGETWILEFPSSKPLASYERAPHRDGRKVAHADWYVLARFPDEAEPRLYRITTYGRLAVALLSARTRKGVPVRVSRTGAGTTTQYDARRA